MPTNRWKYPCAARMIVSASAVALTGGLIHAAPALAQDSQPIAPASAVNNSADIIVTAQKRSQNINDVPMSITAATGDQLKMAGVQSVTDLPKITPGLTVGSSTAGTPVFTIRGVGYNDRAISARPAVTVYLDEAPIPFTSEALGAGLDVERVEVLKGPQGTLFGNNSTGGAINYIAHKPTNHFEAGGNFTYGRFNEVDIDGYVSGPLTDTLSARLAVEHQGGSAWQQSRTRPGDKLGTRDFTNGRFSLLWKPTTNLKAQLTVSRWVDRSDTEAAQAFEIIASPSRVGLIGLSDANLAKRNDRSADWNPGEDFARNNRYLQVTGRIDYDLSDQVTLTSLSTYMRYKQFLPTDTDGTSVRNIKVTSIGGIKSFAQELRLAARFDRLNVTAGLNYANDKPQEQQELDLYSSTLAYNFLLGYGSRLTDLGTLKDERINSYAAFGNIEYELTDQLKLQGGIRYSKAKDDFRGCTNDLGSGQAAAALTGFLNAKRQAAGLSAISPIAPGACITFDSATLTPVSVINNKLDENNVSWRAGLQYEPNRDLLFYGNISKGYKAGGFATLTALTVDGLDPAVQESVLAYEAGFKASLFGRMLQINGAGFYYDYSNKQVSGSTVDPILGSVSKLLNVPKSSITGVELQVIANPVAGLTLGAAGTWIKSRVRDNYTGFDSFGNPNVNFGGTVLPFTPEWQLAANARYSTPVSDTLRAFVGGNVSYQSESFSDLGELKRTSIPGYALVDLQAGIESQDGNWRAYVWGRNIFNKYYLTNHFRDTDTVSGFAGRPATYGVTLSYNYR